MDQTLPPASASDGQKAAWIAGRVQVLLSHYFQPDNPADVTEMALHDWVRALMPFSQRSIERACDGYLRDQPRRRPTPGDIRARAGTQDARQSKIEPGKGDRSKLTHDELELLETKILEPARRWVRDIPSLRDNGRRILEYWGEA